MKKLILGVLMVGALTNTIITVASTLTVSWADIKLQDSYHYIQEYAGRIRSTNISDVGFELSLGETGTIEEVNVDVGDEFKKGDVLARLDSRLQLEQINALKGEINETKANLSLAKVNQERQASLVKSKLTSQQAYDEITSVVNQLTARLNTLNARLRAADIELEKNSLIAPFDGMVMERLQGTGATVQSSNIVFRLIQSGRYQINIGVPAQYLSEINEGDELTVHVDDQSATAKIITISQDREPTSQTHNVLLEIPDHNKTFPNRALAVTDVAIKITERGAWIPTSALMQGYRGLWSVYALKPAKGQDYKVVRSPVRVLFAKEDMVYVETKLADGDKFISDGALRVVPNEMVTLGKKWNGVNE